MSRARPKASRVQLNELFEQPSAPSLQTPKPTQSFHDVRYQYLLNPKPIPTNRSLSPYTSSSNTSHSTNPSPSSTLFSSSTLALRDDEIRKFFSSEYPQPPNGLPSPISPNKATYEPWMLSPEVAAYAHVFPPIDGDYEDKSATTPMQRDSISPKVNLYKKYQDPIRPALPTPPAQSVGPYMHWRKPWMDAFDRGCCVRDYDTSVMFARNIVRSECWNEDRLLDLARLFVWRASDEKKGDRDILPVFASRVRDAFSSIAPESRLSAQFADTLRSGLLATFVSFWHVHKDNRRAIIFSMEHKPNYITYVASALCLCNFIGDLYIERFLTRSDTIGCVRIILHNIDLVEHLTAINTILRHAGTRLWKEAGSLPDLNREVEEFQTEMKKAGKLVQDHRFVLTNRAPLRGTVKGKVEALVKYVEDCKRFVLENGNGSALRAIKP